MKQTREQQLMELLQQSTTNTTAHSLVEASITGVSGKWSFFLFGIVGALFAGSQHDESGFAMIDNGKIYFYKITGLGKRQEIEGRREVIFDRIERISRIKGNWLSPSALNIRWRNNDDKAVELALGGLSNKRQVPNRIAHLDEMEKLLLANNFEIKPDKTVRIILICALVALVLLAFALFAFYMYTAS